LIASAGYYNTIASQRKVYHASAIVSNEQTLTINDYRLIVGLVVQDFAPQLVSINVKFGNFADVYPQSHWLVQVHLKAPEIEFLERGVHHVHLLVVG
jgi:hypothetical protein